MPRVSPKLAARNAALKAERTFKRRVRHVRDIPPHGGFARGLDVTPQAYADTLVAMFGTDDAVMYVEGVLLDAPANTPFNVLVFTRAVLTLVAKQRDELASQIDELFA